MTRYATLTAIATLATIALLLAVVAINLIKIDSRSPAVDNEWREPAWFPPAQPALTEHVPRT